MTVEQLEELFQKFVARRGETLTKEMFPDGFALVRAREGCLRSSALVDYLQALLNMAEAAAHPYSELTSALLIDAASKARHIQYWQLEAEAWRQHIWLRASHLRDRMRAQTGIEAGLDKPPIDAAKEAHEAYWAVGDIVGALYSELALCEYMINQVHMDLASGDDPQEYRQEVRGLANRLYSAYMQLSEWDCKQLPDVVHARYRTAFKHLRRLEQFCE